MWKHEAAMENAARVNDLDGSQLALTVARVHGMLLGVDEAEDAVRQLALAARNMISSAVGAGASLMDASGACASKATTDRIAALADERQYELGEGPCLSAWGSRSVQRIDDTSLETRWPQWCATASELGLRSSVSVPLVHREHAIGALKVYSGTTGAFSVQDEQQLFLLAGAAATLLGAAQSAEAPRVLGTALQSALADRRSVETATGMVMERHGIDHDAAREQLLVTSRRLRRPLAELARDILARSTDVLL